MKRFCFHHVKLIFASIMMCLSFSATAQEHIDPPEGWDIMYFNMGRAEYCATTFEGGSDSLQVELYKDGVSIWINPDNTTQKSCNLIIGEVKIPCEANEYGELIIKLTDTKMVNLLAAAIAENGQTAILEYGDHTQPIEMNNQAAKNMIKAVQWVRNNPIGMDIY